jgi:hypothetical protein
MVFFGGVTKESIVKTICSVNDMIHISLLTARTYLHFPSGQR